MEHVQDYSEDNLSMESIANSALDVIQPNKILKGEIVTIDNEFAYVNVGTKSDGRVSLDEFDEKPNVGDLIDIMLVNRRMIDGMYVFSRDAASKELEWQRFLDSQKEKNGYVSGRILSSNEKGMVIDCDGITAFLPFSHAADIKNKKPGEKDAYLFKIKKLDKNKKNIVLSRRDYLGEIKEEAWSNIINNYEPGSRIKGKVTKFVEFGAFIDVGGIEGLLHKNDITWKRVFKKKNLIKQDEEREFVILAINKDEGKISLGLKQLTPDPWTTINDKYKVDDVVSGKIVTIISRGVFIEIEDGVEGFLNISDVSWTKKNIVLKDSYKKGDTLTVKILGIDENEKMLSLGIKQLSENPWDTIAERFPVGSVHKRNIKKIVNFGLFVELEEDIDGLIHNSDLSWEENISDPVKEYKISTEVEFKVLDIKVDEMKVSCGIKQLMKSPWELLKEQFPPKTKVNGTVSSIVNFGIFVKIADTDVEGLVHVSEISNKKIENPEEMFKVGDSIEVVVLGVDIDKKRLSLSIKQHEILVEKEELSKVLNNNTPNVMSIGDMLKHKQEDK